MRTRAPLPFRARIAIASTVVRSALLAATLLITLADPLSADRGQWTPIGSLFEMGGVPVHMALVRGDGANYHSNVVWAYYPAQFLMRRTSIAGGGGGRVLALGEDPYFLDIPDKGTPITTGWQAYEPGENYGPHSAVLYEPGGRIMAAGGTGAGGVPHGITKTLNYAADSGWVDRPAMRPREYHNLVLLPTGEVLALGGMRTLNQQNPGDDFDQNHAQLRPELWNPINSTWTGDTDPNVRLAPDAVVRNYHSTAILLPCGRVVTAGGWSQGPPAGPVHPDFTKARIFCPPYLFKNDGTLITDAQRPQIEKAPKAIAWGDTFTICTPQQASVQKVSLLRPGATTHHFDQNQRYLKLDIVARRTSPAQLLVRAPASPDSAPPGDYLLFLTGAMVESTLYPDVPSIAKWVSVGCGTPCDGVEPAANSDLFLEIITETSVFLFMGGQRG